MGMYDELQCRYPLPVSGACDLLYQTKDTPAQFMDLYEIREDGSLWHEEYDTEDRSDPSAQPGSFESIRGLLTRINRRWEREFMTGVLNFHTVGDNGKWWEFEARFAGGRLESLEQVKMP